MRDYARRAAVSAVLASVLGCSVSVVFVTLPSLLGSSVSFADEVMPRQAPLPAPRARAAGDHTLAPYFYVADKDAALPLESTRADIHVAGAIADVRVTQVYRNDGKRPLEAVYVFPMSTRAAVHAMKMTVGRRVIEAEIKERGEAQKTYAAARDAGRTASLVEEERPNVFRMSVANILPGDHIRVELAYVEAIVPADHVYELVFPTVVGPRYAGARAPVDDRDRPRLATRDNGVPTLHANQAAPYTFALDAVVDTPVPLAALDCTSHEAKVAFPTAKEAKLDIPASNTAGNRDVIIRWSVEGKDIESGILVGDSGGEHYFLMSVEPPARVETDIVVPREYLFIVDVSGSMGGFPLDTAKTLMRRLLGKLRREDRFDILSFSGGNALFAPAPVRADTQNVAAAAAFMERMEAGGGTELLPALTRTLALPRSGASRIVVVITDGYVDVEKEAFERVRRSLGQANVFAFGIGTAVNRFLIEGLARAGEGEPFVATNGDEAVRAAEQFASYIRAPVLRDIHVEPSGFAAERLEPPSPPDLFAERPIVVAGRYRGNATGTITVSGRSAGGNFTRTLDVAKATRLADGEPLRALWARAQLTWLQDLSGASRDRLAYKEAITRIGLEHHLMTQYTSFVAVDTTARTRDKLSHVDVPVPMPAGVTDNAVGSVGSVMSFSNHGSGHAGILGRGGDALDDLLDGGMIGGGLKGSGSGGGGYGYGAGSGSGYGAVHRAEGVMGKRGEHAMAKRAEQPEVVESKEPTVMGALDKDVIRRIVRRQLNVIRFCYEKELAKTPELRGRLVLKFTIGGDGKVMSAAIASTTLANPAVEACAVAAAQQWQFPTVAGGGEVVVNYPFAFSP